MNKFWHAALGVAGLGAVGSFVFWSLYVKWLSLGIFSNLTSEQTFVLMLVFLVLTFAALIAALFVYYVQQRVRVRQIPNAGSYSVPNGWTFKASVEKIADQKLVEFVNFREDELSASMQPKEFQAPDEVEAIRQLRLLAEGRVRKYTIDTSPTGTLVLTAIQTT